MLDHLPLNKIAVITPLNILWWRNTAQPGESVNVVTDVERNHFEAKCDYLSKKGFNKSQDTSRSTRGNNDYAKAKKYKKLRRVHDADHSDCEDSEDEDAHTREWWI